MRAETCGNRITGASPETITPEASRGSDGDAMQDLDFMGVLASALARSRGGRQVASILTNDLLRSWAGQGRLKGRLAAGAQGLLARVLDPQAGRPLAASPLWSDPQTWPGLAAALPILTNAALKIASRLQASLAGLPVPEQAALLEGLLAKIDSARLGSLVTSLLRQVTDLTREDPAFLAELLRGPFHDLYKNIDFAELQDMAESSGEAVVACARMLSDTLWLYPGKVLLLVATLVSLSNTAVRALREFLLEIGKIAPDLLTELFLPVAQTIDGTALGQITNNLAECLRQVHTGSLFWSEGGRSRTQADLAPVLHAFFQVLDPVLIRKAHSAIAEEKEALHRAAAEAQGAHPELLLERIAALSAVKNAALRVRRRRLELFADLPPERFTQAVCGTLRDLDTQEIGATITVALGMLNALQAEDPQLGMHLAGGVVASLDAGELKQTAAWLVPDLARALKPVAGAILPPLIQGFCELMAPEGDPADEDADALGEALARLRDLLAPPGGPA